MEIKRKKILLISSEPWGNNHVSKHHFAIQLTRNGNKVFFLNPPTRYKYRSQITENLIIIDHKPFFRGLSRLPFYLSGYLIKKELQFIENWLDLRFDIIWNFDSSRFFNLSQVKNKLKIAHIVDWSENFNRKLLSKTSDVNLCTSRFLEEEMKKYNPFTYNIGHGYNPSNYILSHEEKNKFKDRYQIKVGYLGNLAIKYIDWKWLNILISKNPAIGFYFIGPSGISNLSNTMISSADYDKVTKLRNAIFLGEIPSEKIPAYLSNFDILIMMYKDDISHQQLANPHKILEYLGSGKVIVSSYMEEYSHRDDLVVMLNENKELLKVFEHVVKNVNFYNSPDLMRKRKQFALSNEYSLKLKQIEILIHSRTMV